MTDVIINNADVFASSDTENRYLTFLSDNQLYGVSIASVVQIVGMQEISPLPEAPDYAKGVINLRGTIIPVIDTRLRLKKPEQEYDERTCIIISNNGDTTTGFIVDNVDEVVSINDNQITNHKNVSSDEGGQYITGIANLNDKIILLMDLDKLFSHSEIKF